MTFQPDCFSVSVCSALYWFNYELVKAQLCDQYDVSQATFSISFTAGAISGAVSISLIHLLGIYNVKQMCSIRFHEDDGWFVHCKVYTVK